MKKFFTLIALALAAVSANAQYSMSAQGRWNETTDVTVDPTTTAGKIGRIIFSLDNAEEIGGYQIQFTLPEGCTLVGSYTMDGDPYIKRYPTTEVEVVNEETGEVSTETVNTFTKMLVNADGAITIGVFKDPEKFAKETYVMPAGSGEVGHVQIRVPDDFKDTEIEFTSAISSPDAVTVASDIKYTAKVVVVSTEISTSIDRVDAQTLTGKEIYNLSGQRVSKPSQRGIYIVDGKKIMVK